MDLSNLSPKFRDRFLRWEVAVELVRLVEERWGKESWYHSLFDEQPSYGDVVFAIPFALICFRLKERVIDVYLGNIPKGPLPVDLKLCGVMAFQENTGRVMPSWDKIPGEDYERMENAVFLCRLAYSAERIRHPLRAKYLFHELDRMLRKVVVAPAVRMMMDFDEEDWI
jgi:hypothetical protein